MMERPNATSLASAAVSTSMASVARSSSNRSAAREYAAPSRVMASACNAATRAPFDEKYV